MTANPQFQFPQCHEWSQRVEDVILVGPGLKKVGGAAILKSHELSVDWRKRCLNSSDFTLLLLFWGTLHFGFSVKEDAGGLGSKALQIN